MSGKDAGRPKSPTGLDQRDASPSSIDNDASTIPGGEIDPVYEKKAKVLNRAVRHVCSSSSSSVQYTVTNLQVSTMLTIAAPSDPRHRDGPVPVAAVHRRGLRLGV